MLWYCNFRTWFCGQASLTEGPCFLHCCSTHAPHSSHFAVQIYSISADQPMADFPDWAALPPPNATWAATIDCPAWEGAHNRWLWHAIRALLTRSTLSGLLAC